MNGRPTSKGVAIPLQHWVNLLAHMKDIGKSMMKIKNEEDSVDVRYKPGGDLIIGVKAPYWNMDLRESYRSHSGELRPTMRRIKLKFHKWNKLRFQCVTLVGNTVPCVKDMNPCWGQEDHHNQSGMMACSKCSPGFMMSAEESDDQDQDQKLVVVMPLASGISSSSCSSRHHSSRSISST